jgi:hypothetical protein
VGTPGPAPPPHPEVAEFHASSYTVAPGEAVSLTWSTFGADQVTLDGRAVTADGAEQVMPSAGREYALVAGSSVVAESDRRTLAITVNETPQAVAIERFAADPPRIERGRSATLSWQIRNATTIDLDGERAAPVETREVSPLETTTYVLGARGHAGPVEARITVVVEAQKSGLLPDRGGFRCGVAGAPSAGGAGSRQAALAGSVLLGLLALRARRGSRSSDRRRASAPRTGS